MDGSKLVARVKSLGVLGSRSAGPAFRASVVTSSAIGAAAGAGAATGGHTLFAWSLLVLTVLLEVAGTTCMKLSNGFENLVPSVLVFVTYGACFTCLTYAMKFWQVSTAYALWSGLGTALTALIGVVVFREPMSWMKFASLSLIIAGVVGLNMAGR